VYKYTNTCTVPLPLRFSCNSAGINPDFHADIKRINLDFSANFQQINLDFSAECPWGY